MAIVLQKADLSMIHRLGIIDTIMLYVNDVLVASASDEKTIQWVVSLADNLALHRDDAFTVIELNVDDPVVLADLASYLPNITEGPIGSGIGPSVDVRDVTLYIPAETPISTLGLNASPSLFLPGLTDSASVFFVSNTYQLGFSENLHHAASTSYVPTISEGPSGSASAGTGPSVTLF